MRFVVLKDDLYPGDVPFLRSAKANEESSEIVYEIGEEVREKLKVLEEAGFVKVVKESLDSIRSVDDVMRLTERVEVLQGGTMFLRVFLCGHEIEFMEDELLNPIALRKRLLRLMAIVNIKNEEWNDLLRFWFSIATRVKEISEEDEIREEILTYLRRCVIYEDMNKSLGRMTLFYDRKDPCVVFCCAENLKQFHGFNYTQRKIRWLLSDYIEGESVQRRIKNEKHRYWRISIEKAGIDLNAQKFSEEDKTLEDVVYEKNIKSEGISRDGKDNISEE